MLSCALIVWVLQPIDWNQYNLRDWYLTEAECLKKDDDEFYCKKIDKRIDFLLIEWEKDNCNLSEHKWSGMKNN